MSFTTLISADELRALLRDGPAPVILDCSFDLADTDAGERSHREAHVPGARYVHLDRELSAPKTGLNGRHPLPARERFAEQVGAWGITPHTQVVVYDRQQATYAVRAWWMLRWLGHAAVAVLDGGWQAWAASGAEVEREAPSLPASQKPYPAQEPLARQLTAAQLNAELGTRRLIDARAAERYRGEIEPLDAQAGHIPGAFNRFFKLNLASDGRFKSREQLRAEWAPLLGRDAPEHVVHQCGSGVTACHNLLAMEIAGFSGSALYAGSWSEWSADPTRAIARG